MNKSAFLAAALATLAVMGCQQAPSADAAPNNLAAAKAPSDADLVARGEYLVRISGCNDCHTPDYGPRQGEVPTSEWLVGSPLGFKGPWGTTYATNLRLRLAEMDETQWLDFSAKLKTRPIMPDFAVRAMSADDRRALYRFVRSLGPGAPKAATGRRRLSRSLAGRSRPDSPWRRCGRSFGNGCRALANASARGLQP